MDTLMTIEEFNAKLSSEEENSPLVTALRKLTGIEKPEDIIALAEEASTWESWNAV